MTEVITEVDMLMEILAERGKAPIPLVAHVIGVNESVIEEWAKILEKHGMVKLHYPLLGKPVMEFVAADELKEELKERFVREQKNKTIEVQQELEKIEKEYANLKNENVEKMAKVLRGKKNKVEGQMIKVLSIMERFDVQEDKILETYKCALKRYIEMLNQIQEKEMVETY